MSNLYAIRDIENLLKEDLFGLDKNDRRVGLYLDTLRNNWQSSNKTKIEIDNNDEIFKVEYYSGTYDPSLSIASFDPKEEWLNFKECLKKGWTEISKDVSGARKKKVLAVIHKIGRMSRDTMDRKFLVDMIDKNGYEVKDDKNAVLKNPDNWYRATEVTCNNTFATINITITSTTTSTTFNASCTSNNHFTHFNYQKYLIKTALDTASNAVIDNLKDSFEIDAPVTTNEYYRKGDGKLYTHDKDGKEIDLSSKEEYAKIYSQKCAGTMLKGTTNQCLTLLSECIIKPSEGATLKCKDFMKDENFWDITREEVKNTHPEMALKILETVFKFKTKVSPIDNRKTIESFGDWLNRQRVLSGKPGTGVEARFFNPPNEVSGANTANNLSAADVDAIARNDKLRYYLGLLTDKVNASPAILNKGYSGSTENLDKVTIESRFAGSLFQRYGVPGRIVRSTDSKVNTYSQLGLIDTGLASIKRVYENRLNYMPGTGFLVRGLPFKMNTYPYQLGGEGEGDNENNQLGGDEGEGEGEGDNENSQVGGSLLVNEQVPLTYKQMEQLVAGIKNTVKANNKTLAVDTNAKLDALLEKYKNSELNLWRAIVSSERYFDYLTTFKEYDKNDILTIDHMIKFIEARSLQYDKLLGRKDNLVSLIKAVIDQMSDKEDM